MWAVWQPVGGLVRTLGQVFEQQRQVVGQFAAGDLEAVAAVGLQQVDHGLAAVARLAVDVLEQQQAQRTAAVEQGQPALLRGHRLQRQQFGGEGRQLRLPLRRQRCFLHGGLQLRAVFPQRIARVVEQHAQQLEADHAGSRFAFWRLGETW
jgi:hypothetical protein